MVERIEKGEITSGKGLNQETSLHRPGDTRWGSHYITLTRLASMWPSIVTVLEIVFEDGVDQETSGLKGCFKRWKTLILCFT